MPLDRSILVRGAPDLTVIFNTASTASGRILTAVESTDANEATGSGSAQPDAPWLQLLSLRQIAAAGFRVPPEGPRARRSGHGLLRVAAADAPEEPTGAGRTDIYGKMETLLQSKPGELERLVEIERADELNAS